MPQSPMRLVLIESPFAGDRDRNRAYLEAAAADCKSRGEAYYASHAFYTQFLDDDVPEDRAWGIAAGLAWGAKADATVVYADLGISRGMDEGIKLAKLCGRIIETRFLPGWAQPAREKGK